MLTDVIKGLLDHRAGERLNALVMLNDTLLRVHSRISGLESVIEPVISTLVAEEDDDVSGATAHIFPAPAARCLLTMLELDPQNCRRWLARPSALAVLVAQLRSLQDADAGELFIKILHDLSASYGQSVLVSGALQACLHVVDFCSLPAKLMVYKLAITCAEGVVTRAAAACMLDVLPSLCGAIDAATRPALAYVRRQQQYRSSLLNSPIDGGSANLTRLGSRLESWDGDAAAVAAAALSDDNFALLMPQGGVWATLELSARAVARFVTAICSLAGGVAAARARQRRLDAQQQQQRVYRGGFGSDTAHTAFLANSIGGGANDVISSARNSGIVPVPRWPQETLMHACRMGAPAALARLLEVHCAAAALRGGGHTSPAPAHSSSRSALPLPSSSSTSFSSTSGELPPVLKHDVERAIVRAIARLGSVACLDGLFDPPRTIGAATRANGIDNNSSTTRGTIGDTPSIGSMAVGTNGDSESGALHSSSATATPTHTVDPNSSTSATPSLAVIAVDSDSSNIFYTATPSAARGDASATAASATDTPSVARAEEEAAPFTRGNGAVRVGIVPADIDVSTTASSSSSAAAAAGAPAAPHSPHFRIMPTEDLHWLWLTAQAQLQRASGACLRSEASRFGPLGPCCSAAATSHAFRVRNSTSTAAKVLGHGGGDDDGDSDDEGGVPMPGEAAAAGVSGGGGHTSSSSSHGSRGSSSGDPGEDQLSIELLEDAVVLVAALEPLL